MARVLDSGVIDVQSLSIVSKVIQLPLVAQKKKFTPPTIEECLLQAAKIGLSDHEAQKFYYYYDAKGWMVGRTPMVQWRSAMAGWRLRADERTAARKVESPVARRIGLQQHHRRLTEKLATLKLKGQYQDDRTDEWRAQMKETKRDLAFVEAELDKLLKAERGV